VALPHELADLINIERDRNRELELIKSKTALYQISRLQGEEASIKKLIAQLAHKGILRDLPYHYPLEQ